MKLNKRAQFFLIAALILSGIIFATGRIYTSSKIEKSEVQVFDLTNQIQYEASQVIDTGIYNNKKPSEIREDLKNLTEYYANLNPDSNLNIIYGGKDDLYLIAYDLFTKQITEVKITQSYTSGEGTQFSVDSGVLKIKIKTPERATTAFGEAKEVEHQVNLEGEQNFYLVIRKKVKDQDVVLYR